MDAGQLFLRYREEVERIGIAQVRLLREGKAGQVLERAQLCRVNLRGVELGAVARVSSVGMTQRPAQSLELQRLQLVAGGGLDRIKTDRARALVGFARANGGRAAGSSPAIVAPERQGPKQCQGSVCSHAHRRG